MCVCLASLVNIAWELIGSLAGCQRGLIKIGYRKTGKNKRIFLNSPFSRAISGHVEISDVDRDGKNLHQGQAIGNDLDLNRYRKRMHISSDIL